MEDRLCIMFNECLKHYKIPITIDTFEYEDMNLFERLPHLDKYKDVNVLVINSQPYSGQYHYNKKSWDEFIVKLSQKYVVATTEKVNDTILSLHDVSVKNIASIALHVKIIIAVNTGPSIPLYNTHILNNIDAFYLFDDCGSVFKPRLIKKIKIVYVDTSIEQSRITIPDHKETIVEQKEIPIDLQQRSSKILIGYGFTNSECIELTEKAYSKNPTDDIGTLIKYIIKNLGELNEFH
jgi:hypothetical protein